MRSGLSAMWARMGVTSLTAQIARAEPVRPEQEVIGEVLEPLGPYLAQQLPGGGIVYSDPVISPAAVRSDCCDGA